MLTEEAKVALKTLFGSRNVLVVAAQPDVWDGESALVMPVQQCGKYVGCFEVAYGHDMVWDGAKWHMSTHGVFLPEIVFVSDYHGFPEGAFFIRVKS